MGNVFGGLLPTLRESRFMVILIPAPLSHPFFDPVSYD
jgi:hypothetical protein